jgi:hypothetical protein
LCGDCGCVLLITGLVGERPAALPCRCVCCANAVWVSTPTVVAEEAAAAAVACGEDRDSGEETAAPAPALAPAPAAAAGVLRSPPSANPARPGERTEGENDTEPVEDAAMCAATSPHRPSSAPSVCLLRRSNSAATRALPWDGWSSPIGQSLSVLWGISRCMLPISTVRPPCVVKR